jgi:hypothetical protein
MTLVNASVRLRVLGKKALEEKINPKAFGPANRAFLTRSAILVLNFARTNAPVDTGRLRNDLHYQITGPASFPTGASVGTNVPYAVAMEYGTGQFFEGPVHLNPPAAVGPVTPSFERWAQRHGFSSAYQVRAIINRRGGIQPLRYLRSALDDATPHILRELHGLANDWEAIVRS